MIDDPEIQKTIWGTIVSSLIGAVGYVTHKYTKIKRDIQDRPTRDEVKDMIDGHIKLINLEQEHIIDKLDDMHDDIRRLEDSLIRGRSDGSTRDQGQ